ncbi:MAG: amidohydrolase [Tissierella sp.]|nr:amidohydrolase [Tissierella sp.]
MNVFEEAKKIEEYIIEMRRHFHKYPEISWKEVNTSNKICEELDKMNIPYTRVCETGVIGVVEGKKKKPVIGIRADIDALPMKEETDLEFKSVNEGVAHACGHDSHIAMLLGTAKVLSENKDKLECTVKLVFQPAEEFIMDSGAGHKILVDEMKDIDNIVAAHIWNKIDAGTISVDPGPRMSSADTFKIEIKGKGGHGAMPADAIDPIVTAGAVLSSLQTIVSRELPPSEPCVISVCSFNSGSAPNIIPEVAVLQGTTRTFNSDIRESYLERMERIIKNTCESFRADYSFEYYPGSPPTINEENSSMVAEEAVRKVLGEEGLVECDPSMGGEDFAKMLAKIPGCIAFIGTRNEEKGKVYSIHHPKFDIDESVMKNGVAFFVQYVLDMQYKI